MFESIEIRKVKNGVIVTLRSDDDEDPNMFMRSDSQGY
jgi:hypothetical protein